MSVQMYLIHPRDHEDDRAREQIAEFVAGRGGFILMATSFGSLIAAFDEAYLNVVKAHHLVEFAGGVTLEPNAPGAAALQRMFAENVALQLASRGMVGLGTGSPNPSDSSRSGAFPPGYKPLRWPQRGEEGGA